MLTLFLCFLNFDGFLRRRRLLLSERFVAEAGPRRERIIFVHELKEGLGERVVTLVRVQEAVDGWIWIALELRCLAVEQFVLDTSHVLVFWFVLNKADC